MKGQKFYSDNDKQTILYSEQCYNHYDKGNGIIDGEHINPFHLWLFGNPPEYNVRNTMWKQGSGFNKTYSDPFAMSYSNILNKPTQSDAIYHVKMSVWNRIKRWLNSNKL